MSPSAESRTLGHDSGYGGLPIRSPSSHQALLVGQVTPGEDLEGQR